MLFSGLFVILISVCSANAFLSVINDCTYHFGKDTMVLKDQVYNVTIKGKRLLFSPCGRMLPECNNMAAVCLLEQGKRKNLAKSFSFLKDEDEQEILVSRGGARCTDGRGKNYSVTVTFDCKKNMQITPKFSIEDENPCNYIITMIEPNCQLPCATWIHGNLIDLRPLRKLGDVSIPSPSGTYNFGFCTKAANCITNDASDMSACLVRKNETVLPIAHVSSQNLTYNLREQRLVLKGKYKYGDLPGDYNLFELTLHCNWTNQLSNPRYLAPTGKNQRQGRRFRFTVETSLACIKFPMQCQAVDFNQAKYDLSSLNKKESYWRVQNYSAGMLLINMCGQLEMKMFTADPSNECSHTKAQVCHVNGNEYHSKGSLYSDLKAASNALTMRFTDGSRCKTNMTLISGTEVMFFCGETEKGPVFKREEKCVTYINWETPKACPFYEYHGENCYVIDELGIRNLSNVHTNSDKVVQLSRSSALTYNLCGPLHSPCAGHHNVSACLTQNNREVVIGFENSAVKSLNGILSLDLVGEQCADNTQSGVKVQFSCDYKETKSGRHDVRVAKDGCSYNITVFTVLACPSLMSTSCVVSNGSMLYNLSALTRKDSNYVIRDSSNAQVEYSINVCQPVVPDARALCMGSVCRRNATEINFKRRFKTLASVRSPVLQDGRLKIESYTEYCEFDQNYRTVIVFECSRANEEPRVVKTSTCGVEFVWRTIHACGKPLKQKRSTKDCVLTDRNSGTFLNLTDVEHKKFTLHENETALTFDICADKFTKCLNSGERCEPVNLTRTVVLKQDAKYLEMKISNNCVIRINFICGTKEGFTSSDKPMLGCNLNLQFRTSGACENKSNDYYKIVSVDNTVMKTNAKIEQIKATTVSSVKTVLFDFARDITYPTKCCSIGKFNMSHVQPVTVVSKNNVTHVINLSNIFRTSEMKSCPIAAVNNDKRLINVKFQSQRLCNKTALFTWDINFLCIETTPYAQIQNESGCWISIDYLTNEVCGTFVTSNHLALISVVSVLFVIALLVLAVVMYCCYKKRNYRRVRGDDKSSTPIYLKNCDL